MTTLVGKQNDFSEALFSLCELDFDALEAYETAISLLENENYKQQLRKFKENHERHIIDLRSILLAKMNKAPHSPSMKQWLTKGKVVLANLVGDEMILKAMLTNEEDTNTAYQRMYQRADKWPEAENILQKGLADENGHKKWLENILKSSIVTSGD